MTISRTINDILINGAELKAKLAEQVVAGEIALSTGNVTRLSLTIADNHALDLTRESYALFREGTTLTWEGFAFGLTGFSTGGGTAHPTIKVEATSDFVRSLREQTGGKTWGKTDVSSWARKVISSAGAVPYVQPGLGEREIERKEPEADHEKPESTWDVLAEMAKQTGSWLFEYGNRIVLAKPSWLVAQPGIRRYSVTWDTWTKHTEALTSVPDYQFDDLKRPFEGRETLVITAIDPDFGTFPLAQARPGDILDYSGAAAPMDPVWLVTSVTHPMVSGEPVRLTCARPVDPPEILPEDDSASTDTGGVAGVPNGPIGTGNWQGEQLKNAAEIVKEGQRRKLPELAFNLAVATAMGESSLINIDHGDIAGPDSTGLFQQRDSWGTVSERRTPSTAAGFFYEALTATPYQTTYKNGGASIVFGGYYGPGNTANSASVAIHNVQRNSDPAHYVRFWSDAQLIVKACLDAGSSGGGSGGKLSGPIGAQIDQLMASYEGRSIDVDGAFGSQCVDLAAKYAQDLKGIPMVQGNGKDYWNHPGLRGGFFPIPATRPMMKGDIVAWSGSGGAYANGGYGHVAIYSHNQGGQAIFLSQNPGPSRLMPLSTAGVLGMMRAKAASGSRM